MMQILVADDNRQIITILEKYARKEGHNITPAYDGIDALDKSLSIPFDVILLDVMMPNMDGFSVCREIRKHSSVPIIMVTAKGEDYERVMGLDIGADDYIVKPFSPNEVMARIRAVTRRVIKHGQAQSLTYGSLTICLGEYVTHINGQEISLTKKETELLWTLARQRNRTFSRNDLLSSLWGHDYYGDARTVDTHIKRMRSKLQAVPHPDWDIKTIWGIGYKFEVYPNE